METKTEWKGYTGSDDQIAEMRSGFIFRDVNGEQCNLVKRGCDFVSDGHLRNYLSTCECKEILICNPHQLSDMICQQARTGQPVWWRSIEGGGTGLCHEFMPPFAHPDAFEYSFTEFKEEV
ncbi:hypothetical protein Nit79A3_2388 [Nitrosomonas sp. Is79A3]|uniref:hypothetical protein n=1 Tax=Nitrosomonas sp. (strain Is79A3) TaxID=261292 RepID=UPI000215CA15